MVPMSRSLVRIDETLRKRWHHDIREVGRWIERAYDFCLNFFVVPGSSRFTRVFRRRLQRLWMQAPCRWSKRHRFDWKWMESKTELLWSRASIHHLWLDRRFVVKQPR